MGLGFVRVGLAAGFDLQNHLSAEGCCCVLDLASLTLDHTQVGRMVPGGTVAGLTVAGGTVVSG